MSRTYSPKTFLRQTLNALLKAYFAKKSLLGDLDFDKLGKTKADRIMQAIDHLPPDERTKIDVDFTAVNEMATKVNIVFYADPADAFMKAILE